ncbi:MAG: ABC transporter substrate-binding protein, partial [Janthinobacterium lividum]
AFTAAGLVLGLGFAWQGAGAQSKAPIVIGASLQLSGPVAYVGESARQGIDLQVDAINAAGGLLGRPVKIVYRDHENVPDKAVTNVREMIERDQVVAFVGESSSGTALAAGPVIGAANLPWVISVATNTSITKRPQNTTAYRVSPYDGLQAPFVIREALRRYKKVAILADNSGYGQGGRQDLLAALKAANQKPVADETYNIGEPDMTAQLSRIRSSGAEVIVLWSLGPDAAQIRRNMRTMNYQLPTIGGWGLENTSFTKLAGRFAEGTIIVSVDPLAKNTPAVNAYRAAYDKKIGLAKMEYPSAVALSYDAMGLLAAAIRKAGTTDSKAVITALQSVDYDGVIKHYHAPWSATQREALSLDDLHLVVVKDGKFQPYTE